MSNGTWTNLIGADPTPWLLESDEPAARWAALTHLTDRPDDDPEVADAHRAVLSDPQTEELIARLPDWEADTGVSGHQSPGFAPNLLHFLADMGLREGDDPRIDRYLDTMLAHQLDDGHFASFGRWRDMDEAVWGALPCDHHAITEVLVRYGRGGDPRVRVALGTIMADIGDTNQGRAWRCVPDPQVGFRGPGRKDDFCPMVTLEALRTLARLPADALPAGLGRASIVDAARVALCAWRVRGEEKPYMFGHGRQFKTVKWPPFWYDIHWMLDTLGRFPELWGSDANASSEAAAQVDGSVPANVRADRRAMAELTACLVAYNFGPDGRVTPRSCCRGFETFSFGRKKQPSPFATARLAAVVRRMDDLADEARTIDVTTLGSSKGGTGTAVPPRP